MYVTGSFVYNVAQEAVGKLTSSFEWVTTRVGGNRQTHKLYICAHDKLCVILDTEQLIELRDNIDAYIKLRGLE